MPVIIDPDKWDDPCATYKILRNAYFRLLAGEVQASASYMANGVSRTVNFSGIDLRELQNAMSQARMECEEATGMGSGRFAISAGAKRQY